MSTALTIILIIAAVAIILMVMGLFSIGSDLKGYDEWKKFDEDKKDEK